MENVLFPSLYEEDYILRSLGSIVTKPDIALTELVANAWDAGASNVKITIPTSLGQILSIEDDGTGMNEEEFEHRWMTLRYNRLKSQGNKVLFPKAGTSNRFAFGRNGVGRHGLFCFSNEYKVITKKDGKIWTYVIKPNVQKLPFAVIEKKEDICQEQEHGTKLEVIVEKNLPSVKQITEILSAKFLLDPQFEISINNQVLDLDDLTGNAKPEEIKICNADICIKAYFIDTNKASRKSIFQGIAFWQAGRLVGDPSWDIGNRVVLDGRTSLAKRYSFVFKSDDFSPYIKEDWSGFIASEVMEQVYDEVENFINRSFESIATVTADHIRENLDASIKNSLDSVNPLAKHELECVITEIVRNNPKVKQESVDLAVQTLLNMENSKNGHELLEKLSTLSSDDIDGLNQLLSKWTVRDALVVLNEIDRRLSVITAIRKLSKDPKTDELHVLHPMIAESRWLFGPEYESSEYIFNNQMRTAVNRIFPNCNYLNHDTNYKNRPDLICLPNSTLSVTGLEDIPNELGLVRVRKLLLIELKKGGFKIKRDERNQAQGYVEDLLKSNLGVDCQISAYVVGDSVADNLLSFTKIGDNGLLYVTTYDQLVDTAEKRMFGLRSKIASRYDDVPGMDLYAQLDLFNSQ